MTGPDVARDCAGEDERDATLARSWDRLNRDPDAVNDALQALVQQPRARYADVLRRAIAHVLVEQEVAQRPQLGQVFVALGIEGDLGVVLYDTERAVEHRLGGRRGIATVDDLRRSAGVELADRAAREIDAALDDATIRERVAPGSRRRGWRLWRRRAVEPRIFSADRPLDELRAHLAGR